MRKRLETVGQACEEPSVLRNRAAPGAALEIARAGVSDATGLERPTSGQLLLDGHDAGTADAALRKRLRPLVQMVFQNPFASLNPRKKVGTLLAEPLAINTTLTAPIRTCSLAASASASPSRAR